MALKIIYGRSGSGKTTSCFKTIANLIKEGKKVIYIVPEQLSFESERRITSSFSACASSFVEVLSMQRLAHQVFTRFGPLYQEYINDSGRLMLLQKALIKVEKKLTVLSDAAQQPSFANDIIGTISELKRHNVCYEELEKVSSQLENPILKLKLLDLSIIYKTYCEGINNMGDDDDSLSILCERISKFNLFTDTVFIIDQFSSFTPQEYNLIKTLLRQSDGLIVTITTDSLEKGSFEGINVFSEPKETANRLIKIAIDEGIKVLPNTYVGNCKKYQDNSELMHLEQNYFKYPAKEFDEPTNNVIVYAANNYYGEVESVAKRIISLCRDKGYRFKDIVILTRNEDIYFPLIKFIFDEYDISYFIGEKTPATKHPISQFVISIIDILINNWNTNCIMRYLKFGFCDIDINDIYLLENYVIASGLNYSRWINKKPLTFIPKGFEDIELNYVNTIRQNVVNPLIELKEKFSGRKTVKEIIINLYQFLIENQIDKKVQKKSQEFFNNNMPYESKKWQLSWNSLIETFDQMVNFLGEEHVTFNQFVTVLKSGLSCVNLSQVPPMVDQVQVSLLDGFKSQGHKVLILIGTNEGVFPKGYMQEGILSDADRTMLRDKGLELAQDTVTKQLSEQYLIYQCITAAAEKLLFFYPLADDEGGSLTPSPIIARLNKLFNKLTKENNIYVNIKSIEIEGAKSLFWQLIAKLSQKEPLDERWQTLYNWYKNNWNELFSYANDALEYTNLPKRLSNNSRDLLYPSMPYTSISRIEGYSRCQFAHFIQYGLKILPRKEYTLKAVDVGSLMHGIIEQFSLHMQNIEGGWDNLTQSYAKAKVDEICDKSLKEYLGDDFLGSAKFNHLSLKLKRIMRVTILNIAQFYKNSSFEPLGYELDFGTEGDLPPLELELKNGKKVRLVGKIDRVDICKTDEGNYISIIDYKSSSKDVDYSYVFSGMQVQLPAYIDAICKALSKKDNQIYLKAAMLYYKIDAPLIDCVKETDEQDIWNQTVKELKMRGIILDKTKNEHKLSVVGPSNSAISADKLEHLCRFTLNKLKSVMEEMLDGNIKINPYRSGSQNACQYCPYSSVCQFDTNFIGNKFRSIRKLKKEEFFENACKMD